MCDKSPEKQHIVEKLPDDGSVVTQKNAQHVPSSIIYPKAHLYYAFAEDIHPSTRIAVSKSLQRERLPPLVTSSTKPFQDPLSEIEAVNRYLLSDPLSFVIFGKPGLNSVDLASKIADTWKCVLISPSKLIQEEIDSGSVQGRRMKETLVNGECIAPDIVMNLMRRRVKMRDVLNRGYIVKGLPLIPDEPSLNRGHSESCKDQMCDQTASCDNTANSTRRVPVPDARFDYLCEYFKPASKVPAFLHVMDIAGLVQGAAEGQGLGNSFLSHIGACDGIFHLCRAFEDDDVTHVEGDVNPVRDLDIISEELRLKDVEFLSTHLEKLEKLVIRGNDKKLKPEYDTLLKVKGVLMEEKKHIRFADWSANDIEVLNKYLFLTSKPIIYLVNLSEKDYIRKKNKWLIKIKEWVDKNDSGAILIPFSGIVENKLLDMDEAERAKYFEEHKVTSALDKIIVQGYKALQLQYFFTAGHDEVKAWTIQKGTKAPQAAGKIHTDFEKGFIMAEVMKFDDFKNEGSEASVKAAGKYRQQGRNYVVEDGDIIFFKFNAGAGLKDAKKK